MSAELEAEIARLKAENTKLARDLAGAHDDLKEVRGEARDRRHENKTLAAQLGELATDRDKFKAAAEADPEGLRKSLDGAQQTIRALKHDGAFAKVAKGLKVSDPTKFADLLKLASYQPEGDEPDEAKIAEAFQGALKGRPWLADGDAAPGGAKDAPGGDKGASATQAGGKPGPGADRGQSLESQGKTSGNGLMKGWGGG
jgi:hypothetical protein